MTDNYTDLIAPFEGLTETDLLELYVDKVGEFLSRTDTTALQEIDDEDSFLLNVPDGFSVEVQGVLFFEDMGYLSYMQGDTIIPLYLCCNSLSFDWREVLGLNGLRSLLFTYQVFCDTLFQLTGDSWYMSLFGGLNSILWSLVTVDSEF